MAEDTTNTNTASAVASNKVVKFVPFSSTVDSPFWVRYCHLKLETIRLKEDPIDVRASYGVYVSNPKSGAASAATANRLQCLESGLLLPEASDINEEIGERIPNDRVASDGILLGYNTKESFQKVNKNQLLKDLFCRRFFHAANPSLEAPSMVLLTFADLKQHKVLYWFGFPTLMTKVPIKATLHDPSVDRDAWWTGIARGLHHHRVTTDSLPAYFALPIHTNTMEESGLKVIAPLTPDLGDDFVYGFVDPTATTPNSSNDDVLMMGWPMRNLIAYLVLHADLGGKTVWIVSLRPGGCPGLRGRATEATTPTDADGQRLERGSVLLSVQLPRREDYDYGKGGQQDGRPTYKVVGWELNARHKPGPRWVNLRPLLDQNHLAIQAADLNLKLMKWRMIPDLSVDMLQKNCKVLLLGAGTLGCSVARTLLGWGIRDFTFVDYGTVSYSNPVRQVLFTLADCHYDHGQGKPKAQAAADALKQIAADVKSEGIRLSIPMPGHASENDESLHETVAKLDELIRETDVVFLLTDTRESRWLPTVMAAVHDKILINAALGLDSWLVMRHGASDGDGRLGCYFCNDVVAPENSTKNRTLDQQCTVTRPGLAPIASSMAVELLVSLLHHPLKQRAPGPKTSSSTGNYSAVSSTAASPLGVVPHQIRGSIVTYTMMTPTVPAFFCCTGCSTPVLDAYRADKFSLVGKACASMDGSYLENLSGLTAFRAKAAETLADLDDLDWSDDDEEEEGGEEL